jgi:hypothetical protein
MKMGRLGLLLLAWILPAAANAKAAEEPAGSILFENDLFYNADHDYTNGTELSYTTAPDQSPAWAHRAAHFLLPFFSDAEKKDSVRTRFALGQAMFTPTDITLVNPPLNDRPYAAFFFGSIGVVGDATDAYGNGHFDQVQLTLGAIGPMAAGEEVQKFIHAIVHGRKPSGWHYQLRDEPGLVLQYERTLKLVEHKDAADLQYDIEPHFGGAVGNVWDYVNAGAMARIGFNMPKDYGPMRIQPSLPGSDYFEPGTNGVLGAYIFAGIEGRAVARNLFLDGNSFESSRSVSKLNLVGDLVLGAAVTFDCARLAFSHVIRTREYKTQGGDDQYGAVDLTLRF